MEHFTGEQAVHDPKIIDRIHECGQDILDDFVRICKENGFRYYLAAGTLLGAVRHKGPIPWDDDVDVYMPRADADAFKKLMLDRPDGEPYHIQCYENEPTFVHFYLHHNKRGTVYKTKMTIAKKRRYMELWLDIFPLDDHCGTVTVWDKLTGRYIASFKRELEIRAGLTQKLLSFRQKIALLPFKLISDNRLWLLTDWLMRRYNRKSCDYYVSWTGGCPFPRNIMPKDWFEPDCKLLYNGKYYNAPGQWDKVLTQRYGVYMQLPPEDKRKGHHMPIEIRV